nr:hypothetical protein [Tanacetum cinerariifolium]
MILLWMIKRMHPNREEIAKLDADEDVTLVDVDADTHGRMKEDDTAVNDINDAESEPTIFDDEEMAKRLQDEEIEQAAVRERQEKEDLERAKVLQQQYDQKQEDIYWNVVAEQMQEKHLDNVKKYQSLKRKPISVAQARKNMIVYLKNMAGYKIKHFKKMTYDQTPGTHDGEAGSSRSKRLRQQEIVEEIIRFRLGRRAHNLTLLEFAQRLGLYQATERDEEAFNVYFQRGLRNDEHLNAHDYWLSISREEHLCLSQSHTSTIRNLILRVIHKIITDGLCQRTTRYDKVQNVASEVLTEDVVRNLSAPIYCRDLDATTLRDLIDSDGKLIPEDPQPSMPRVGIPRPPRASMLDLYDMMGRMEIRQDAIERMELGSHVTRTCIMECLSIWQGFIVFYYSEPTTRLAMLSRSITSTISSISLHHHSISSRSRMMTSSVEMARVGFVTAYVDDEISNLVDLHIGMFGGG